MKFILWVAGVVTLLTSACGDSLPPDPDFVVVATVGMSERPALGPSDLYVVERQEDVNSSSVYAIPKIGGAAQQVYRSSGFVQLVAADAQSVYFLGFGVSNLELRMLTLSNGNQRVLDSAPQRSIQAAIDDTHVYFGRQYDESGVVRIKRIAKNGANVETLGDVPNHLLGIVVDGTSIFGYSAGSNTIWSLPKTGGTATMLTSVELDQPSSDARTAFVADDAHLYYFDRRFASVARLPKSGGPQQILAPHLGCTASIAVSSSDVYWACNNNSAINRVNKTNGTAQTVNDSTANSGYVVVDDSRLYWGAGGEVRAVGL